MPYVNIKVTGGSEVPSAEQKKELVAGVTELIGRVLNKNTSNLVVVIEEIAMENYGIGGKTVKELRGQ